MRLGMCPATLLADPMGAGEADVRAAVEAAAGAGFTELSVWAFQLPWMGDLAGLGLHVTALEAATAWAAGTAEETKAEADRLAGLVDDLGASHLLAVTMDPELPDFDHAQRNLGIVVAAAERAGARVCVEFLPWSGVPDLATAWRLVEPVGADLLIDTWHWARQPGGPNPTLLATIPGDRVGYVQISDAGPDPGADLLAEAMSSRLLPGEGVVDFAELFGVLADIGADPFVATEVFNPGLVAEWGPDAAAAAMRDAAQRAMA